jgi:hypothetical protein
MSGVLHFTGDESVREGGTTTWLAALNPKALKVIKRSLLFTAPWHRRMFFNVEQAAQA